MAKRFGAQHIRNGYAAMGGAASRPIYSGFNKKTTVADSIAKARRQAAMAARIKK